VVSGRHESVGGSSLFVSVFGVLGHPLAAPQVTTIRRTLQHVLDFSIRPKYVAGVSQAPIGCLQMSDRLYPGQLETSVVLPTTFYASQWGVSSELSSVFGLAARLRIGDVSLDSFRVVIPVQLLHAVLVPLMTSERGVAVLSSVVQEEAPVARVSTFETQSWLPSIARWLPHLWIDITCVTDRAVKAMLPKYPQLCGIIGCYCCTLNLQWVIWICCVAGVSELFVRIFFGVFFDISVELIGFLGCNYGLRLGLS
jgi:hypothetical protein